MSVTSSKSKEYIGKVINYTIICTEYVPVHKIKMLKSQLNSMNLKTCTLINYTKDCLKYFKSVFLQLISKVDKLGLLPDVWSCDGPVANVAVGFFVLVQSKSSVGDLTWVHPHKPPSKLHVTAADRNKSLMVVINTEKFQNPLTCM